MRARKGFSVLEGRTFSDLKSSQTASPLKVPLLPTCTIPRMELLKHGVWGNKGTVIQAKGKAPLFCQLCIPPELEIGWVQKLLLAPFKVLRTMNLTVHTDDFIVCTSYLEAFKRQKKINGKGIDWGF